MSIKQREKSFLAYLKKSDVSNTTLSLYPLALRERIPQKLEKLNEQKYKNLFECLDIKYLEELHKRLLTNGDLYEFSQGMSKGVPSATIGKYIKFLEINNTIEEEQLLYKENNKIQVKPISNLTFSHKYLLLKGVPGTGKSKTIDNIIENDLDMNTIRDNVLRINIHSASSNSDLMQGISIFTDDKSNILYQEKRGAVLKHIFKAMFKPNQPFVLDRY